MITSIREFILKTGKGIIITATLPFLKSCGSIVRESVNAASLTKVKNKLLNKDYLTILRYASLAPSGHNSQPWEVEITAPGHWKIKSNINRWLPAVDPDNREGTLSLGPFIENLVLAGGSIGYTVEIDYQADSLRDTTVANVKLKKDKSNNFPLDLIKLRRTVRKNHLKRPVKSVDLSFITGKNENNVHFFPADSTVGKFLAEGTLEANKIQISRDDAQSELSEWIRWSNSDAKKYRTGMTPASMDIKGLASLYVRLFYNKDDVMSESFRKKSIDMIHDQVNSCGGWLVITSDSSTPQSLIEAGRRFQKIALRTRERMLAVHPMMQLLEEGFTDKVQSGLGISEPVQFVLRTSYLEKYPDPVSLRRPVEWFVSL